MCACLKNTESTVLRSLHSLPGQRG